MSGGSLDYLYLKLQEWKVDPFLAWLPDIRGAIRRLAAERSAEDDALAKAFLHEIDIIEREIARAQDKLIAMAPAIQEIEWWLSNDGGPDDVATALRDWFAKTSKTCDTCGQRGIWPGPTCAGCWNPRNAP